MRPTQTFIVGVRAVVFRPSLWRTALGQARRFVPDGWWRHRPFLPFPDPALLRFRAVTQYGDPEHGPRVDDLVLWLRWCKSENQRRARG